jgi:hypothetical protein
VGFQTTLSGTWKSMGSQSDGTDGNAYGTLFCRVS